MRVLDGSWETWPRSDRPTAATIGVLDGVHRGHRALLARLGQDLTPTVLTFDPHPAEVLRPGSQPRLITTIDERLELLADAGVDLVGVLDLAEIKELKADQFVEDVLAAKFDVAKLVVGADFRFGKDRSGDVALLTSLSARHGFELEVVPLLVSGDDLPISSSRIRDLIEQGDVAAAAVFLQSFFSITNIVIHGDERGRALGFPTANLRPPDRKVVPAHGVYSCFALVGDVRHDAAVNVGVRPTFGGGELLIEAHVLDFDEDLYDRELTLEFVAYLRPELAFPDVDELVRRMGEDVSATRRLLAEARAGM